MKSLWYLLTISVPLFSAAMFCLYRFASMTIGGEAWNAAGWIFIVLGIISTGLITYRSLIDVFVEKTDAISRLFDSAKFLDRDRTNDLLAALGIKPMPDHNKHTTITITQRNHQTFERSHIIPNIPISDNQLLLLSRGLILDRAPFSRREWVERRRVLSDAQFRNLQSIFAARGLIELKDPANVNGGYILTSFGRETMESYASNSPTPQTEEAYTQ